MDLTDGIQKILILAVSLIGSWKAEGTERRRSNAEMVLVVFVRGLLRVL